MTLPASGPLHSLRALALLAMFASTAACAGGQPAASEIVHPSATAGGATALPSISAVIPSSTPLRSASPAVARRIASAGPNASPLAPGRWQTTEFKTPVAFTVGADPWTASADHERFVFLRRPIETPNGLVFTWVETVFSDPCGKGWAGEMQPWTGAMGPAEFFAWLAEQSPVDFGAPAAVTIAGHEGLAIERLIPEGAFEACAEAYFPMVDVLVEPPGDIGLPRYGQRFLLAAVRVESMTVMVLAFAGDGDAYAEHSAAVDDLLASLEFLVD